VGKNSRSRTLFKCNTVSSCHTSFLAAHLTALKTTYRSPVYTDWFAYIHYFKNIQVWKNPANAIYIATTTTNIKVVVCRILEVCAFTDATIRLQGPSQLSTPLYSQLILRIYAAMNGLGGDAKTEFAPGRGETPGTPLCTITYPP